jgi:hypothetical protein
VKVTNDKLNAPALDSPDVVSARYAFQVDMYIASPTPPKTAEDSSTEKFAVNPGTTIVRTEMTAPASIKSFRPYRSDRIARGTLRTTVVNPHVVSRTPRSVTDIPSSGRNTGIATE